MKKGYKNLIVICTCVVVVGAGGTYFVQKTTASPKTEIATITYSVKKGDLSKTVSSSGNIEASDSVDLSFSGKSKVTQIHVNAGDSVTKGQVLAEMDATSVNNALLLAQANYDSSVAKLKSIEAGTDASTISDQKYQVSKAKLDVTSAQTELSNAKKISSAFYLQQRVDLAKAAVISAQTILDQEKQGTDQSKTLFAQVALENAQNAYKQAATQQSNKDSLQTSLSSLQNKLDSATRTYDQAVEQLAKLQKGPEESELAMAKAEVAQALASLNDAKGNMEGIRIIAPYNGIVSAIHGKVGELVSNDASAISMFSTEGNYKISTSIDDTDITDVKVGQDVQITFDALTGVTMKGKITSKAVLGEIQSSGLVTFPVTVELNADQENMDKLIPGLSATLAIITDGKQNVLIVPDAAIKSFGGKKIVMLDNNGTEEQKEITTGLDDGARTEVLTGLSEGDKVTISMTTTNKTTTTNMQSGMGGFGGFGGDPTMQSRQYNRTGSTGSSRQSTTGGGK